MRRRTQAATRQTAHQDRLGDARNVRLAAPMRKVLADLLIEEARRREVEASQVLRKDSPQRIRLLLTASELRALAKELAS